MSHDIFISYSRVDLQFVEKLVAFLQRMKIKIWFDRTSLLPGQRWEDVIEDEIPRSRIFLVCFSKAAVAKSGYFHVEQHRAADAALRIPPERLFVLPTLLGDCDLPRNFRQYHAVNLIEPGAIEMLLRSLSSALEREVIAEPEAVNTLRGELIAHLGKESIPIQAFVDRFMKTEEISFQDSVGIIEQIANSSHPNRLSILYKLRSEDFLSYAEQAALDMAINNVKIGVLTRNSQEIVRDTEMNRIDKMNARNEEATALLRINKYFRYISRKGTQTYQMAEAKIARLLAGRD